MAAGPVIIRKYGNRRLYDTSTSRYINLDEIARMIRNGTDVQVRDAKTGRDVTRLTLTQIIAEDAKGESAGLPLELLRQLVVASDKVRQEFMSWYLKSAFDSYQKVQHAVQSGLEQIGSVALSPFAVMKDFLPGTEAQPPAQLPKASSEASELARLRKRVAELEARAANKSTAKTRKKKARATRA